jgi:hypothetical protein
MATNVVVKPLSEMSPEEIAAERETLLNLYIEQDVASQKLAQETEAARLASVDVYGRDNAERTIELDPHVAAAINAVINGESIDAVLEQLKAQYEGCKCKTFDETHGYLMFRGMAEYKRQEIAAVTSKLKAKLLEQQKLFKSMVAVNPSLMADPKFVEKMMVALGMKPA